MDFSNCILIFGGVSEERMVSVATGQNIAQYLNGAELWFIHRDGAVYQIPLETLIQHKDPYTVPFEPKTRSFAPNLEKALEETRGRTMILGLHGTEGEDGTLQKLLTGKNIAYTGSGPEASKLAFDKKATKIILKKAGLPVTEDAQIHSRESGTREKIESFARQHNFQMVLKPVANGSSVGLFIVKSLSDMEKAFQHLASLPPDNYLMEPFLHGREMTVGVWDSPAGVESLAPSEVIIETGRSFDYLGKYLGKGTKEITPADLTPEQTRKCCELAAKTHKLVGCDGYSRTDMILTDEGPVILEINTLPGMTKASFFPQQLSCKGIPMKEFFGRLVFLAEKRLKKP